MGSKNRIFLGIIIDLISHFIRNEFDKKELYVTKTKYNKIKNDHSEEHKYLNKIHFQVVINNTVGYCLYQKEENIYNFVTLYESNYYIFSISTNNHFLELGTFFRASPKRLKKCVKEDIRFLSEAHRNDFQKYLERN